MELIDLSNVNGDVNFARIRQAGIRGVWLKATEGVSFDDQYFQSHRRRANAAGLRVGGYHFGRPDNNTPTLEAAHFARVVGKLGRRDLRPVLDLEKECKLHPVELEWWARAFCQEVQKRLGVIPIFYSYPAYIGAMRLSKPIGDGLWLASYGANDGKRNLAVVPKPWKRYVAHQYTSDGHVDGVNGKVDRSYAPKLRGVLARPVVGLL